MPIRTLLVREGSPDHHTDT
ncbi:hypothetical protein Pmani_037208, partial [Petrolisthes manimaculis]